MNTSVTLWTFLAKVTCCRISRFQLRTPFVILCAWLMDVCDYNLIDFRLGHVAYLCLSSFHTIQTLTEAPHEAVVECISRNILLIHNICSGSVLPCDGQYFKTNGLPKPRAITISRFWVYDAFQTDILWCTGTPTKVLVKFIVTNWPIHFVQKLRSKISPYHQSVVSSKGEITIINILLYEVLQSTYRQLHSIETLRVRNNLLKSVDSHGGAILFILRHSGLLHLTRLITTACLIHWNHNLAPKVKFWTASNHS